MCSLWRSYLFHTHICGEQHCSKKNDLLKKAEHNRKILVYKTTSDLNALVRRKQVHPLSDKYNTNCFPKHGVHLIELSAYRVAIENKCLKHKFLFWGFCNSILLAKRSWSKIYFENQWSRIFCVYIREERDKIRAMLPYLRTGTAMWPLQFDLSGFQLLFPITRSRIRGSGLS